MSSIKQGVLDLIRSLPDGCTLADIHYSLCVSGKVVRGLGAIGEGRVVPQAEAERKVREWLESGAPLGAES